MADIHRYEKGDVICRLETYLGKRFGEIDNKGLFDHVQQFNLQKGIAGHVVEQCIFGYSPDSRQEADLVIKDDGLEKKTELKTTGMILKKDPEKHYEAKEPMSITAVGVPSIGGQEFYTSHFWEKLEHMLIVYYYYSAAKGSASPYDYKGFPLVGYEFHEFSKEEEAALKQDWEIVRNLCAEVVSRHPGPHDKTWEKAIKQDYIDSHGVLRPLLSYIDLAPLYPPRFRLKKSTVSMIIAKHFGYELEQLPGRYTYITDIDRKCHELTRKYAGKTIGELVDYFGIPRTAASGREGKGITELLAVKMFGGESKKLNDTELFQRFGLIGKTVVVTATGGRTEDMKLYHIDFDELTRTEITDDAGLERTIEFGDSEMYTYFSSNELLCIIYKEPDVLYGEAHKLVDNVFLGFKRLVFDDSFIEDSVKSLWEDTRNKVMGGTLVDVVKYDSNGLPRRNKSGDISSAPNFMKSKDNDVFIRGSGTDSALKHKTECVNGIRMLPQYVWIKGKAVVEELEKIPFL